MQANVLRGACALTAGLVLFCSSCEGPSEPNAPGIPEGVDCVDLREDWREAGENEYRIEVPTMVVPPGEEHLFCYYGTFNGPDSGVVGFFPQETTGFLHHTLLKQVMDDEYDDGHLMDCTAPELQWPPKPVLFESVGTGTGGWINLPEGIAFKLSQGQRWVADVHYVNVSPDAICMNTAFYLDLIPESEVDSYAAAFNLDVGFLSLPPEAETTESFHCEWEEDLNILSISSHMHEYGEVFDVLHHSPDSPPVSVYRVDEWEPNFQSRPPVTSWEIGEFPVSSGDSFETQCTWFNSEDSDLGYPDEMCTAFGVAYPLEDPLFCDDGVFNRGGGGGPGPGGGGAVEGQLTRTASLSGDGLGDIHIFIQTSEPGPNGGSPIAMDTLENVDLSGANASLSYELGGLPKSTSTYYITAFFDDDESGYMDGPTSGDLVVSAPAEDLAFVLSDTTPVTINLELNQVMD